MSMVRQLIGPVIVALVGIVIALALVASCNEDVPGSSPGPTPVASGTAAPTATPVPTQEQPEPTELRVAFINLLSPLTLDTTNQVAGETFDARLDMVIKELKAYDPDIVGFNEASRTKVHGDAIAKLARELKMEFYYARANPWFPGQDQEGSDKITRDLGFEEGELLLVRGERYPVLKAERRALNPRTSEFGEGRAALHLVVKGPKAIGEFDVYITHLTGGGDAVRRGQLIDLSLFISSTRGEGPTITMIGQSDPASTPDVPGYFEFLKLVDVGAGHDDLATCCREAVLSAQPLPPLTLRTDYLLAGGWIPQAIRLFGIKPTWSSGPQNYLYASDHNGLLVTFPVPSQGEQLSDRLAGAGAGFEL